MFTGNKGEWSEYYAFLKLLVEGRLDFGGPKFNKLDNEFYSVMKISRNEEGGKVKSYETQVDGRILIRLNDDELAIVNADNLNEKVKKIFQAISASSGRSFSIALADETMQQLRVEKMGARSQLKEDLIIKIHDDKTGTEPEIGFSIKSMVGGPATLLNASGATNFIFEVKKLSKQNIEKINAIEGKSKIRDRLKSIFDFGGHIEYIDMTSTIFKENLRMCDTVLPEILAQMILLYNMGKGDSFEELIEQMVESKLSFFGLTFDNVAYGHKIENLLHAVALGMVPNKKWDGFIRAYGGYIVVRSDGELVGYSLYKADVFRKYLLKSTKLETGSSTRHGFGKIYEEADRMFIKFNLQIRFKK